MSELKVNKITPRTGTTITLGDSGDSLSIASGVALTDFTSTGIDDNATSTALTIDSSGNVLIGKTSTSSALTGTTLWNGGYLNSTVASDYVARFNRTTSDGDVVQIYKDNASVGSIGNEGTRLQINTPSGAGLSFNASSNVEPMSAGSRADNQIQLGADTYRFSDLYLGGNIYLGGTGSANALDDYEEGTFTPTYLGSTTNPSVTYDTTVRYGEYTKIGRKVFINLVVRTDAVASTGSGSLRVGGLPFTTSNEFSSATRYGFVVAGATSFNSTPVNLVASTEVSQDYIKLSEDYGGTSFNTSELQDGANFNSIRISGFYVTTA